MAQRNPPSRSHSSRDRQPRTFRFTITALLTLPYRLCNPPPAVGKVRSCKVTPMFKVKLDDVLNKKHLPPLGLKDFEEWLLFVEGCPENLYFLLWLKEYAVRYDQWVAQTRPAKTDVNPKEQYRFSNQVQHSTTLTLFYLRAKQTFFTPGAEYELNIPSDLLSPFHTGHFVSPHPDPIVFSEVAWQVHNMLKESLDRFVLASYYNVGTNRALCGMIGGTVIALAGFVPPMAVNFATDSLRWLRLLALPGLWFGLTVLVASLHGVCMMVYIFGDLRQLRKFELSRPRISPPKPLDASTTRPLISSPLPMSNPDSPSNVLEVFLHRGDEIHWPTPSPQPHMIRPLNGAEPEITVSPAYFDPDPAPEGPATRTGPDAHPFITDGIAVPSPSYRFGTATAHSEECRFNRACYNNTTAGFIGYDDDDLYERPAGKTLEEGRPGAFDFDSFRFAMMKMRRAFAWQSPPRRRKARRLEPTIITTSSSQLNSSSTFLSRAQRNCSRHSVIGLTPAIPANHKYKSQATKPPVARQTIENQHHRSRMVPAFGPVTRVLSPVVSRAQWEIVVRSALVSMILSLSIVGCLLAIPERH
ncbi:hypothetical protein BGW80DRAFT_1434906 [Lactifluus volemus]|nr:hypothetical protein BGW80DRAFT_1434906 [Lactifluus volemus]